MNKNLYFLLGIFLFTCTGAQAQVITTIAGDGVAAFSGDGGPATAAELNVNTYIATDPIGNLFIVDGGSRVRKIDLSGIITTFAGTGTIVWPATGDGGPATAADFDDVGPISADASNVYISDFGSSVRKVAISGIITELAGQVYISGFGGDGGQATAASLEGTSGTTTDGAGNVYICDFNNHRVRKVAPTGIITTFAGNGMAGSGGDGGPATNAQINPRSVAVDAAGNVFISDADHNNIRKVNTTGIISTYAGTGTTGFGGDGGPATAAEFNWPEQMVIDMAGNLFICDIFNSRIRKINPAGMISTIAGNGTMGYAGDGGPATAAELWHPEGVAVHWGTCGEDIYISDQYNHRIRKVVFFNHPPAFTGGHTQTLTVCADTVMAGINPLLAITDSDAGQTETWGGIMLPTHGALGAAYSATSTGGTITPAGLYYTPESGYAGPDSFRVIVYDCGNAPDTTTIYVTVLPGPAAGLLTGADTVCTGHTITLADTAAGGTWSAANGRASVVTGVVTGITAGTDTILYSVTNTCGTAVAKRTILVKDCLSAVAAEYAKKEMLQVYPDPNDGTFAISLITNMDEEARVVITDMVGARIKELTMTTNKTTGVRLDAPPGIYFLTAISSHGSWSMKMVISR